MTPESKVLVIGSSHFSERFSSSLCQNPEIGSIEHHCSIDTARQLLADNTVTHIFLDGDVTEPDLRTLVRELRHISVQARIITFIGNLEYTDIKELITTGINSIISKSADMETILEAIQQTTQRKYYLCPVSFTSLMRKELLLTGS